MSETPDDLMAAYERATAAHDLPATLAMIDDEAVYLFSDESSHVGKAAVERVLRHNFKLIEGESYSIDNLTWLARSDDVAACVYDYRWSGRIGGREASMALDQPFTPVDASILGFVEEAG